MSQSWFHNLQLQNVSFLDFTKEKRNLMNKWNIMENSVAYKQLLH